MGKWEKVSRQSGDVWDELGGWGVFRGASRVKREPTRAREQGWGPRRENYMQHLRESRPAHFLPSPKSAFVQTHHTTQTKPPIGLARSSPRPATLFVPIASVTSIPSIHPVTMAALQLTPSKQVRISATRSRPSRHHANSLFTRLLLALPTSRSSLPSRSSTFLPARRTSPSMRTSPPSSPRWTRSTPKPSRSLQRLRPQLSPMRSTSLCSRRTPTDSCSSPSSTMRYVTRPYHAFHFTRLTLFATDLANVQEGHGVLLDR